MAAKASVTAARNSPGTRSAGIPMTTAATAPTTTDAASANRASDPRWTTRLPVTPAPIPAKPNWPSEICPAQPDRTTRETATIA